MNLIGPQIKKRRTINPQDGCAKKIDAAFNKIKDRYAATKGPMQKAIPANRKRIATMQRIRALESNGSELW